MHGIALLLFALLAQSGFGESLQEPDPKTDISNPPGQNAEDGSSVEPSDSTDYLTLVTNRVIEDDGANMAEELIESGYSSDIAQQIASELAADIAACILDAVSSQAAARSLDVDWYLRFFAGGSGDPNTAAKLEKLDVEAAAAKWQPCINRARVARGLQPKA